jgi:hypothetical protein
LKTAWRPIPCRQSSGGRRAGPGAGERNRRQHGESDWIAGYDGQIAGYDGQISRGLRTPGQYCRGNGHRAAGRRMDSGARNPDTGTVKRRSGAKEETEGVRDGDAPGGHCAWPIEASLLRRMQAASRNVHIGSRSGIGQSHGFFAARTHPGKRRSCCGGRRNFVGLCGMVVATAVSVWLYRPVNPNRTPANGSLIAGQLLQ